MIKMINMILLMDLKSHRNLSYSQIKIYGRFFAWQSCSSANFSHTFDSIVIVGPDFEVPISVNQQSMPTSGKSAQTIILSHPSLFCRPLNFGGFDEQIRKAVSGRFLRRERSHSSMWFGNVPAFLDMDSSTLSQWYSQYRHHCISHDLDMRITDDNEFLCTLHCIRLLPFPHFHK
jgi:hypothetical protein